MPLFQERKTLPLEGLSEIELAESDSYFEAHGVTRDKVSQDVQIAGQVMRKLLEKLVKNPSNRYWVYYLLGNLLFADGQVDDAVSIYSRATLEYPDDPRACYSLGVIYYGIYQTSQLPVHVLPDVPLEIRERISRIREFENKNPKLLDTFRGSKMAASLVGAAELALKYFHKTLACNIFNEDKAKILIHIRLIETQMKL